MTFPQARPSIDLALADLPRSSIPCTGYCWRLRMRSGQRWSVASTSKKPPGVEGGQRFREVRIRFGYTACCPPAHQWLPTGSSISTRLMELDSSKAETMLESFIATRRAHSRSVDSTAFLCVMSTSLVIAEWIATSPIARRLSVTVPCQNRNAKPTTGPSQSPARAILIVSILGQERIVEREREMSILLGAHMPFALHGLSAHGAHRAPGGGQGRRVSNEFPCLRA